MPDPVAPLNEPRPIQKRPRWPWIAGLLAAIVVVAAIVVRIYADDMVERRLRPATIALLEERFQSDVELGGLTVRVFPTLAIEGQGLVLRHKEHREIPPLITIETFTIEASVRGLWTRHIDRVHLTGLHITIPPGRREDMPALGGGRMRRRAQTAKLMMRLMVCASTNSCQSRACSRSCRSTTTSRRASLCSSA